MARVLKIREGRLVPTRVRKNPWRLVWRYWIGPHYTNYTIGPPSRSPAALRKRVSEEPPDSECEVRLLHASETKRWRDILAYNLRTGYSTTTPIKPHDPEEPNGGRAE